MSSSVKHTRAWEYLRFAMAGVFLWAFFDKLYGLGFATPIDRSWLSGVSPTSGFLTNGTSGPLSEFFQSMSGSPVVDWLFMTGLVAVGASLLLGIGMNIATASGSLMMGLIYLAGFPPQNNPVLDEHIIYILLLWGMRTHAGYWYGLRSWWQNIRVVKQYPVLV